MRLTKKSKTIIASAAIIGLASCGVAYAYWTTSGNGSGSASTDTSSAFEVTTDIATGGPLTPGGLSQTVAFHVKNPSTGVQRLTAVAVTVANPNNTSWIAALPGCSSADYTVSDPTFTTLGLGDLAPGVVASGTVTVTMNNNLGSSQNGCKLVVVPLYVAAS